MRRRSRPATVGGQPRTTLPSWWSNPTAPVKRGPSPVEVAEADTAPVGERRLVARPEGTGLNVGVVG